MGSLLRFAADMNISERLDPDPRRCWCHVNVATSVIPGVMSGCYKWIIRVYKWVIRVYKWVIRVYKWVIRVYKWVIRVYMWVIRVL